MAQAVASIVVSRVQSSRSRCIPHSVGFRATQNITADPAYSGVWCSSATTSLDSIAQEGLGNLYAGAAEAAEQTAVRQRVEDIIQPELAVTSPQSPLREAAAGLQDPSDCLPVVDDHFRLVGLLSERDARKQGATVQEVMRPALAVGETDSLAAAANIMLQKGLSRVPVVDSNGRVVGAVTKSALFWCLADYAEAVRPH